MSPIKLARFEEAKKEVATAICKIEDFLQGLDPFPCNKTGRTMKNRMINAHRVLTQIQEGLYAETNPNLPTQSPD